MHGHAGGQLPKPEEPLLFVRFSYKETQKKRIVGNMTGFVPRSSPPLALLVYSDVCAAMSAPQATHNHETLAAMLRRGTVSVGFTPAVVRRFSS